MMTIRRVQSIDLEPLLELWEMVFPDDPSHNAPRTMLPTKLDVDDLILVAWQDGELIGACMLGYDGYRGWLYAVAVHPEHRRKGIGASLINTAFETLKSLGCIKVNLQIRDVGNTEVVAFYESLGFEVEPRISMGKLI